MRVKFEKGKQRYFLKNVLVKTNCPSLKELINRGFDFNYSTLKNYYSELRLMPEELVRNLCLFSKIDFDKLDILLIEDNWGRVLGGKIGERK